MKKLKNLLQSNTFYVFLFLLLFLYCSFYIVFVPHKSKYEKGEQSIKGVIIDYSFHEDYVEMTIKGKEKLKVNYYKTIEEDVLLKNVLYGSVIQLDGNLVEPTQNTTPYAFNYKKYLNTHHMYYQVQVNKITSIEKSSSYFYKLKNRLFSRIEKIDSTGYMLAFLLGDKERLPESSYASYQKCGIAHLFALSGMHIGVFTKILSFLLQRQKALPKFLLLHTFLFFYLFLVGCPASLARCVLFFFLSSLCSLFSIKISTIKVLLLTIFFLLLFQPFYIFDTGFLYSVCTVFGILFCSAYIEEKGKIRGMLRLSIVCFLFSLGISLYTFYSVNVLSVFYNLFYIPFVSLLVYPVSLLSFLFPFLEFFFRILISFLESSTSFLAEFSFGCIYMSLHVVEVLLVYAFLLAFFYFRKYRYFCFFLCILIIDFLFPFFDSRGYIYFFDVGQGDSSLVISPYRKDIILIDTGGVVTFTKEKERYVSDSVLSFLKAQGIFSIDLLILTHGDADHAKEVEHILKTIDIKNVKINLGTVNTYEKKALDLIKGREYKAKNMYYTYLNFKEYGDENSDSVWSYFKIYNTTYLNTGDANKKQELDFIERYKLSATILKLGHHGSKTSSALEFLEEVNPKYSIISSGRKNRYHHPSTETIENLEKESFVYFNTQDKGTIKFTINENSLTYSFYEP